MKSPKVTFLMTVYNGEKYLKEAITSILNQTFKDFELVVIDDWSTDSSAEMVKSFNDPRIRLIRNRENLGPYKSSNIGLKLARGKFIARMDADDVSLPDRLENELSIIEKKNDIGMVACWITIVDENNDYIGEWHADRENNSPEEIYYTLFFKNCIAHSSVLFKKDIVVKLGGYNEAFRKSQDYELWIRLSKIAKIVKIKRELVIRREYDENTSLNVINQHRLHEERLFLKNIKALLSSNVNSHTLFSIKYNNSGKGIRETNIIKVLNTLNNINPKIVKAAPCFLDRKVLIKCGKKKRNKILKNSFPIKFALRVYNITPLKYLLNRYRPHPFDL